MKDIKINKGIVNIYSSVVKRKVLLAEEDIDNKKIISLYIRVSGVEVDIAVNAQQAIEKVLQNNYDLILIDMDMLIMDSMEPIRLLKSKTPIVALTTDVFLEGSRKISSTGCSDYLTKPIDRKRLYEILRQYLQVSSDEITPLRSSLLDNEPELHDLIKKYIHKYPVMIKNLNMAFKEVDLSLFEMLLHDIKSTGGNYGFMLITDLAVMIKTHLNNNNVKSIKPLLDELEMLHQRMMLAL